MTGAAGASRAASGSILLGAVEGATNRTRPCWVAPLTRGNSPPYTTYWPFPANDQPAWVWAGGRRPGARGRAVPDAGGRGGQGGGVRPDLVGRGRGRHERGQPLVGGAVAPGEPTAVDDVLPVPGDRPAGLVLAGVGARGE